MFRGAIFKTGYTLSSACCRPPGTPCLSSGRTGFAPGGWFRRSCHRSWHSLDGTSRIAGETNPIQRIKYPLHPGLVPENSLSSLQNVLSTAKEAGNAQKNLFGFLAMPF